ncbi:S8 family serine peptidase, partial [Clostridium sp.]|uniref:S8 family serine peptidase n=1 Tax=Clostridium sp. TaxID=1506 RepID=UPI003F338406
DIGVDKLHKEGITGKGIKVGVIDTGIDYNHPDLKDNYKGGWDCIDEDDDPMETTYEDWKNSGMPEFEEDGSLYYTSHGTHVSGTIAGTQKNSESEFSIKGVAPDADLYAYRVLGEYGSGYTSDIIQAIEMATEEGLDVINLSLGSSWADVNDPLSIACNNAMLSGIVTVIANGNSGPDISTVGTPAVSALSISVGASSTSISIPVFDIVGDGVNINGNTLSRNFKESISNIENKELEIVDCGLGKSIDFEGKDLKGKVALIKRGELTFDEKLKNASKAGATLALVYNTDDAEIPYYLGESSEYSNSLAITKSEGEAIKSKLNSQEKVTLKFHQNGETTTEKDVLADFSSRGPVASSKEIKPDVTAPGVSIISTYPEYMNNKEEGYDYSAAYGRISGTSMASPHVAGLAALVLAQNEDLNPFDVKVALMNTSDDLARDYGVNEVGAGRIDAYQAVKSGAYIKHNSKTVVNDQTLTHNTGSISFGRVSLQDGSQKLTEELIVENNTNKTTTFDVSVEYVSPDASHAGKDAVENGVKLDIKESAVVSKNKKTTLKANMIVPKNAEAGLYQGYINLQDTRNKEQKYQIPFSVYVSTPGVEDIKIDRKSISNDNSNIIFSEGVAGLHAAVKLTGNMSMMHIIIKDSKTGEIIGTPGSMDISEFNPEYTMFLQFILNSATTIFPYEDGEFKKYRQNLKEGMYDIEFIVEDNNGKYYKDSDTFIIDNTPVKNIMTLNGKEIMNRSQVIEISKDMYTDDTNDYTGAIENGAWIKGTLYDSSIDMLKNANTGYFEWYNREVSQGENVPFYYVNDDLWNMTQFKIDENGNYKFGVNDADFEYDGKVKVSLRNYDMAHASDHRMRIDRHLLFVEEGRTYIDSYFNKETINKGEDNTYNLKLNNANDLRSGTISFFVQNQFKVKGIEMSDKLKGDYKVSYDIKEGTDEWGLPVQCVDINIEPKDSNSPKLKGDMDLIKMNFELKDDSASVISGENIKFNTVQFKDIQGKEHNPYYQNTELFVNTNSSIKGHLKAEGLVDQGPLTPENIKANINITDSKGNSYDANFIPGKYYSGYLPFDVVNIPITEEYIDVNIDMPGHFPTKSKAYTSKKLGEERYSKNTVLDEQFNERLVAGDVNSDDVIDIEDAKLIENLYGQEYINTKEVEADINQDGVVDAKDMAYVEKNFGKVNPQSSKNIKAHGTKTMLQSVISKLNYKR